mgnify:CR=1 FL=1
MQKVEQGQFTVVCNSESRVTKLLFFEQTLGHIMSLLGSSTKTDTKTQREKEMLCWSSHLPYEFVEISEILK